MSLVEQYSIYATLDFCLPTRHQIKQTKELSEDGAAQPSHYKYINTIQGKDGALRPGISKASQNKTTDRGR